MATCPSTGGTIQGCQLQAALLKAGYDPKGIDGIVGPNTKAALRRFQAAHGLSVTDTADDETLVALGISEGPALPPEGPALPPSWGAQTPVVQDSPRPTGTVSATTVVNTGRVAPSQQTAKPVSTTTIALAIGGVAVLIAGFVLFSD